MRSVHWSKRVLVMVLVFGSTIAVASPTLQTHAASASMHHYVIQADFVLGARGLPPKADACIANAVFHPGEQVVWRARIIDSASGKEVTVAQSQARGITATVTLKGGKKFTMMDVPHGENGKPPFFWVASWVIGKTYPFGPVGWTIKATDKSGSTATFAPIGQEAGIPSIIVAPAK